MAVLDSHAIVPVALDHTLVRMHPIGPIRSEGLILEKMKKVLIL